MDVPGSSALSEHQSQPVTELLCRFTALDVFPPGFVLRCPACQRAMAPASSKGTCQLLQCQHRELAPGAENGAPVALPDGECYTVNTRGVAIGGSHLKDIQERIVVWAGTGAGLQSLRTWKASMLPEAELTYWAKLADNKRIVEAGAAQQAQQAAVHAAAAAAQATVTTRTASATRRISLPSAVKRKATRVGEDFQAYVRTHALVHRLLAVDRPVLRDCSCLQVGPISPRASGDVARPPAILRLLVVHISYTPALDCSSLTDSLRLQNAPKTIEEHAFDKNRAGAREQQYPLHLGSFCNAFASPFCADHRGSGWSLAALAVGDAEKFGIYFEEGAHIDCLNCGQHLQAPQRANALECPVCQSQITAVAAKENATKWTAEESQAFDCGMLSMGKALLTISRVRRDGGSGGVR